MEPTWKEYRNRDLKRINLDKILDKTVDKIQQEWHNFATYFDWERIRMERSRKSGAGTTKCMKQSGLIMPP